MRNSKSRKRHIDKKSMNVIFRALCVFWILFLSASMIQVMAQETKEYEKNDPQTSVQEKFNLSAGIGMPEHLNIGFCYQLEQVQIGLYIGSAPYWYDPDEFAIRTLSSDLRYHFGGLSKLSYRRPWFVKFGIVYIRVQDNERNYSEDHTLMLVPRVGRDFNFTEQLGAFIDIGSAVCLYEKNIPPSEYSSSVMSIIV